MLNTWRILAITLLAMVVVLGGGFGVQASMLHTHWRVELGTLPDWLAAFGTVVALIALVYVARQWRASEAERHDAEAKQARLIIVELEPPDGLGWYAGGPPPLSDRDVRIVNHSSAPVFHLHIESEPSEFASRVCVFEGLRHGRPSPPDRPVFAVQERTGSLMVSGSMGEMASTEYVAFTFTDAQGVRWRRVGSRQPIRVFDGRSG